VISGAIGHIINANANLEFYNGNASMVGLGAMVVVNTDGVESLTLNLMGGQLWSDVIGTGQIICNVSFDVAYSSL